MTAARIALPGLGAAFLAHMLAERTYDAEHGGKKDYRTAHAYALTQEPAAMGAVSRTDSYNASGAVFTYHWQNGASAQFGISMRPDGSTDIQ
jgi:hypothetical protein